MKPTLALSMIVRNVQPFIRKCLNSVSPFVDEIVIVDTGSTDGTKLEVAGAAPNATILDFTPESHPAAFAADTEDNFGKDLGPFTGKQMLIDFAAARNFGWERRTSDYILWLDSDDVLVNGDRLPEILQHMVENKIDTAELTYDYGVDDKGNVNCTLLRERITRRGAGASWHLPIHEILGPPGVVKTYDQVKVRHQREQYKLVPEVNHRNLKALVHWWRDRDPEKEDPRMLYYLARDEMGVWPERAIEHYRIYVRRSGWDEERSIAYMAMGKHYEDRCDYAAAFTEYSMAAAEASFRPDPFFGLARIAYHKQDWGKCIEWTQKGFDVLRAKDKRPAILPQDPLQYAWRPYVYYAVALIRTGQDQLALDACNEGLKANPNDPHLRGNKEFLEKKQAEASAPPPEDAPKQVLASFHGLRASPLSAPSEPIPTMVTTAFAMQLWKRHMEAHRYDVALCLLDMLPRDAIDHAVFEEARAMTKAKIQKSELPAFVSKPPLRLAITIWTGEAWEQWTPRSMDTTGIGGSEIAATWMARELQRRGHDVEVVSDCPAAETFEGVRYIPWRDVVDRRYAMHGDVCVVSRQPGAIDYAINFKQRYLWVHDVHAGLPYPALERMLTGFDGIFALSNWHKQYMRETYPFLSEDRFIVTRNGIDTRRFEHVMPKSNNLVYSSSWDRGLGLLLELMPRIRVEVPDAELHVYYGSKLWKNLRPDQHADVEVLERAMRSMQAYVSDHGRVSQGELAAAFLQAKVWLYPTWFHETSCISAMEAQAAGCVPVCTALAALPETVKHGVLVDPPCTDEKSKRAFVEHTVRLLRNDDQQHALATSGRAYGQTLGWDKVAASWEALFLKAREGAATEEIHGRSHVSGPVPSHEEVAGSATTTSREPTPSRVRTLPRKHRVAVMMGRLSTAIHGVYNIDTLFDEGFLTGTGSNFFGIAWGLAERGHTVDVFCQAERRFVAAPKLAGANVYNIDGNPGDAPDGTYDAYIAINEPDLLRQAPASKLRACAMWLNDWSYTQSGFDEHVDIYACPSWIHARYIHDTTGIPRDKLTVIPLAINPEFYNHAVHRAVERVAYCSSPDRGLHHLLAIWPDIRAGYSSAELRIYYRIQPWLDFMLTSEQQRGNEWNRRAVMISEQLERLGRNGENGVHVVGPVPAKTMAKELLATHVLAYPCDPTRFTEGFSVTIMDACAAGCVPIITAVDAFPEVYGGVAHMVDGRPEQQRQAWIDAVLAGTHGDLDYVGHAARAFAARHTRQIMAARWEDLIEERRK